jgi:hypothetical protein
VLDAAVGLCLREGTERRQYEFAVYLFGLLSTGISSGVALVVISLEERKPWGLAAPLLRY